MKSQNQTQNQKQSQSQSSQEQKKQNNNSNAELQAELQILASNYEALQSKLENSNNQLTSLLSLKETISQYPEIKNNDEILVSLGSNIFTKALLKKDDLIVGIGSDTLVNKSPEEVSKIINSQIEAVNEFILKLEETLSEISSKILKKQLEANK